jgi:RNA polymerase sigma-70 factor, ECF subfamily
VFGSKDQKREAFSAEVMIHLDHLYRVAWHLVRNPDEAQDLVQETCVRAFDADAQFTPGTNMKAWLTKILHNLFYDNYHRNKRMVSLEDKAGRSTEEFDYWEKIPIDSPGPEKEILRKELSGKIGDALKRIPEEFRVPIVLVDMGDLSYAEAAEILSCPIGTIRSRLSRGRRLLHQQLRSYLGVKEKES